jgi:hypothetical protein
MKPFNFYRSCSRLVLGIWTEEAGGLDLCAVNLHAGVLLKLLIEEAFGHCEELVKVYFILIAE